MVESCPPPKSYRSFSSAEMEWKLHKIFQRSSLSLRTRIPSIVPLATFQYHYLNPGLSSSLGTHVSPSVEKIISCEDDASKIAFGSPVGEGDVSGNVASSLESSLNSSDLHPIRTII